MPRRLISVGDGKPLLDIASYARRGPGRQDRLSHEEIELIDRTVRRTPEVMVKVLSRGGQDLKAVGRHIAYLNRGGELEIETDDGQRRGKGVESGLLEDWDLDLEEHRRTADLESRSRRASPKLVHKLLFSMPPGTPPGKVLAAVKDFAREEFGLKHRYAMALHTDEPHPHVHMVVKAVSEQGVRLNIRKATLREWRRGFARHLRAYGVPANATERAVRGNRLASTLDGIYRAALRGDSTRTRTRAEAAAAEGNVQVEQGKSKLIETREEVEHGWKSAGAMLLAQGHHELAAKVRGFIDDMPAPMTEKEQIVKILRERMREQHILG